MSLLDRLRSLLGSAPADGRQRRVGQDGSQREGTLPSPADFPPEDPLRRFGDRWEPVTAGMDKFVVYPPPEGPTTSIRRCSTLDETRRRLEFWYGDDGQR